MKNSILSICVLLVLSGLAARLYAQEAEPANTEGVQEVEPTVEPQLFEFEMAGFSLEVMAPYEPVIRESSDGSVYAITYQRRAADGGAFDTDGKMAFLRLTQTIAPLAESGTVEALMDSIIREAVQSLDNAYGKRRDRRFTDCSLEILGGLREGKRIDAGMLPDGAIVYAECYAFEDKHGNGIGVTIKLREPVGEALPEDALLAEELLIGLQIKDLEPDSQYFFSFAGYPLRLPVGSMVQNMRQVNQFVYEATIGYPRANARVQLIKVPPEYNLKQTAADQLSGYAGTLEQQSKQGQLSLKRSARSYILAGEEGKGVVEGMSFALNTSNTDFYNTMHTVVDQGVIVAVSFTGAETDADIVTQYVADFFARPLGSIDQGTLTSVFDGYALELPNALSFVANDKGGEQDQFIVSPSQSQVWQRLVESPLTGDHGHTRILGERPGSAMTLGSAHRLLCEQELNRLGDVNSPTASLEAASVESTIVLEDGRTIPALTSTLTPVIGAEAIKTHGIEAAHEITITSYGLPADAGQAVLVVSTVASTSMYAEADLITRMVLDQIEPMETPGRVSLSFGVLELPPFGASVSEMASRDYDSFDEDVLLTLGRDTVRIRTTRDDPRHEVLSSRLLGEQYLPTVWRSVTSGDEQERFPKDAGAFASVAFAGQTAAMFESQLAATGTITGTGRMEAKFVRVFGFAHGEKYTSVVIQQDGEKDADRLDWIMSLFEGPDAGGN